MRLTASERREKLIQIMAERRHETISNLAFEFSVTIRTIQRDIVALSCCYPLETVRGRFGGGVKLMDGYYLNTKRLTPKQQELLQRLKEKLTGEDLETMNTILSDFTLFHN